MMVGRLLSFWDGEFSGSMLNFQGVITPSSQQDVAVVVDALVGLRSKALGILRGGAFDAPADE